MTQPAPGVAGLFDVLAEVYDQTGIPFFGPVGERLSALLEPAAGERCLDVGCGRGAVTLPLARAVGPSGSVHAVDVSPAMVTALAGIVEELGLHNVTAEVADAQHLEVTDSYDVVASSLVIFFLPEPLTALRSWVGALVPGGRIGLTTFGTLDGPTEEIDRLLEPYAPPSLRDPRTTGAASPFASDAGMEQLLQEAGAVEVRTDTTAAVLEFADVGAWHRFAMTTGQRAMLTRVPDGERPELMARIGAVLDGTRAGDSPARVVWQMRTTLGRR